MVQPHSPTVRGRRLARELRQLRADAEITPEQAAVRLGWSRFKISRIERAQTKPSAADLNAMLDLYGADGGRRAALDHLAKNAWRRGWWTSYKDVFTGSYVGLEDEAATIRSWQIQVIPGLLQTELYARHLLEAAFPGDPAAVDRRLQARMARKTLLSRKDAPVLDVVLDEAALRRKVGSRLAMKEQLLAIALASERPNVTVRVLANEAGAHAGLGGPFVILGFGAVLDEPDVVYVEGFGGDVFLESADEVARSNLTFNRICDVAMPPERSVAFIADVAEELSRPDG
ncbi:MULTISPECIES: helix-turn-helix domain-containing protein [Actinomadura]|uniref:Helix-turn-helix domain-containing protein n=1 Tax=Actinomadura yumaensis TaxID=111807 RepID=A0ABW2CEV4_9ACTN|nr:helix-turn-helix transcriptional regulator [Actinomadura sp. J1-007]MWK35737.1 helix-turn-helix domain-containing protein [Actinomadura sp. J1-007]